MLYKDMGGLTRFYVRGNEDNAKAFTVELTWYTALAQIGSVNKMDNGDVVLNLIVDLEAYGNMDHVVERRLRELAAKYDLCGFATWDEYRMREGA